MGNARGASRTWAQARAAMLVLVSLCLVALLAGCGSSSSGAAAGDPASAAPANSLGYIEVTVRPQGSQHSDVTGIVHRFSSIDPDALIQQALNKALNKRGLDYAKDVRPWLGQKIAVAITSAQLPDGLVAIAPSNDAAAGVKAIEKAFSPTGPALIHRTYHGVSYDMRPAAAANVALGVVGKNVVIGGVGGFEAVVDAAKGQSLADQPTFSQAMGALPSSSLARGYGNLQAITQAILSAPTLPPTVKSSIQSALSSQTSAKTVAFGVAATGNTVSLDFESFGGNHKASSTLADVSGLPAGAWIALATGALPKSFASQFNQGLALGLRGQGAAVLGALKQRLGFSLSDIIGALGPIKFEVQGNSIVTAAAGLSITPTDMAAATRLVGGLRNLLAGSGSLALAGTPTSFTLTTKGAFTRTIAVTETATQVLATFNLSSPTAFIKPSTTLATESTFQRAKASLPSGATVPFYINFAPLASILGETPQFASGGPDNTALKIIQKLDYLIVGSVPGQGHFRIVFAMH